jgi:hypothetical protein
MRHMRVVAVLGVLLAAPASATGPDAGASAAEPDPLPVLTLFDLDLQRATPAQLRAAIKKAGGKPRKPLINPGPETYDVTAIGLPGIQMLEVTFHKGRVVAAVYRGFSGTLEGPANREKMRKMLVEKYGPPAWHVGTGFGDGTKKALPGNFTDKYVNDGKYGWDFAGGMQLVFKTGFGRAVDLTYLDPQRFAELKQVASDADANDARAQARQKGHAF